MESNAKIYFKEMSILFVDDEDGVRESYEMLLNMWFKKAYSASNGAEGLEAYKQYKPDIIVTDIKMPIMNGLEMIRNIKEIDPDIPIIITTAHQEPELLLDAVELHVDGYIVKPIAKKILKKRLETIAKSILFERKKDKEDDILRNIIDTSLEAMLVFKGNVCINVNNAALDMFGFEDKSEMVGKESLKQIGKLLQCVKDESMECENKEPYETLLFNKDDKPISALVRCKNITIGEEKLKIIDAVDLSQIKKLEAQTKKKDEIMIAQSRHAAMGEMISMIAHQWRQPITAISMAANNLLADVEFGALEEESTSRAAKSIMNQTKELSKTIDDFRNFFKPEKEVVEVLAESVLSEALSVIGKSIENNEIEIVTESTSTKKINTYSRELMQVIINMLKNAKEALVENRENDRKIFVYVKDTKSEINIKICDNAGGIDDEILDKIFHPYFTTKDEANGTGLGLYMSKTIVEKHLNGILSAYNENDGACFEMRLPYIIK